MLNSRRRLISSPLLLIALVSAAMLVLSACGDSESSSKSKESSDTTSTSEAADSSSETTSSDDDVASRNGKYDAPPTNKLDPNTTYTVRFTTNKGTFDVKVDPKAAPKAAANFVFLAQEGYYDGVVFHRVIKDFMVQTGDPTGTGTGGPGYSIKDDPVKGTYKRGTVAMANAGPDTGGSQFFIVHGTTVDQMLPKDYVIFGSVDAAGMKSIDKIAEVDVVAGPSGEESQPVDEITIESAEVIDS